MQDRVSLHPGRVKLVPVAGQENTYDMVRADSPTQEGTPLNTDSLLKVATAALYGLPNTAVPDEVLAFLSKAALLDENGNVTDFNGTVYNVRIETGSYTGTGNYGSANKNSLTFGFPPKFLLVVGSDDSSYATGDLLFWVNPATFGMSLAYYGRGSAQGKLGSNVSNVFSVSGNTLTWYYDGTAAKYRDAYQHNTGSKVFYWFAVG